MTVNVVPKQVIRDQAITTLQSALENVPGVRAVSNGNANYVYKVRGFGVSDIFRNQINPGYADFFTDLANVERVEVLKGPASILYGRAEPGGLINVVTKQPLFTPHYVVEQQIGNYDHYLYAMGSFGADRPCSGGRVPFFGSLPEQPRIPELQPRRALPRRARDHVPAERRDGIHNRFTVFEQRNAVEYGIPTLPNTSAPVGVPSWRSYKEQNGPDAENDSFVGGYVFRHNLDENWKVVNRFNYSSLRFRQIRILQANFIDTATQNRRVQAEGLMDTALSTNISVEGKFQTFGARHNLMFGLDYLNEYYDYYLGYAKNTYPINLFAPVYGTVPDWHIMMP